MPKDLISFTIAVVLIGFGLWGAVAPKSFSKTLHDSEDGSDVLNSNPSPRLQFGIRVVGVILVVCGVCLGIASIVGVNNPPDFDPSVF
jgi:hypothetical protein